MKIARADLTAYRLPYRKEVTWSDVVEDSADYVLLELTGDNGAIGMSEVTCKPTWSGVTVAAGSEPKYSGCTTMP